MGETDVIVGFQATLATLDSKVSQLLTDGPMVIITASFEGEFGVFTAT